MPRMVCLSKNNFVDEGKKWHRGRRKKPLKVTQVHYPGIHRSWQEHMCTLLNSTLQKHLNTYGPSINKHSRKQSATDANDLKRMVLKVASHTCSSSYNATYHAPISSPCFGLSNEKFGLRVTRYRERCTIVLYMNLT